MPFPNTKKGRTAKKRFQRSIKNKKVYEGLRRRGMPKSRAAAIANSKKKARRRRKR